MAEQTANRGTGRFVRMGRAALWFRALSFVMAAALLIEGVVALTIPTRFYATRQQHYGQKSMPAALMVPRAVILSITTIAWYAALVHYRPWGWGVTGPRNTERGLHGQARVSLQNVGGMVPARP